MNSQFTLRGVLALFLILLSTNGYSATDIYSWTDSNGVRNYVDDPSLAPPGAKVVTYQELSDSDSAPRRMSAAPVSEGRFVLQLAKELGNRKVRSVSEAKEYLSGVRISPPLGHWALDQNMTPELTLRLRELTLASSNEGWLGLNETEALIAFDTAAAMVGLPVPLPAENLPNGEAGPGEIEESPEPPSSEIEEPVYPPPPEAATAPYADMAATPPLVTFAEPLPYYYPYYDWYPVWGGFWAGGFYYSGYYVLNTPGYFRYRCGANCGHHFPVPSPGAIRDGFVGRLLRNHVISKSAASGPVRSARMGVYPAASRSLLQAPAGREQMTHFSRGSSYRGHASHSGRSGRR
jgi:hypothetical protein